ncbi:rCG63031 [Rattus norvegicus]|uniref:RCG63031 n=1 Tax=Rattus norvegicus TaxID=10116 RepID=A6HVZ3_RAT|nr:rCG63031 [Rattus norvegicus]
MTLYELLKLRELQLDRSLSGIFLQPIRVEDTPPFLAHCAKAIDVITPVVVTPDSNAIQIVSFSKFIYY